MRDLIEVGGIVKAVRSFTLYFFFLACLVCYFIQLVDELMVECPHRWEGCETTCQRQMVSVHLKEECLFGESRCQVEDCGERMKRSEMEEHMEEVHGIGKKLERGTEKKENEEEVKSHFSVFDVG